MNDDPDLHVCNGDVEIDGLCVWEGGGGSVYLIIVTSGNTDR